MGAGVVNKQRAKELIQAFETPEQVTQALDDLRDYWDGMLANYQVQTDDGRLDRMVNIWNAYQCMVTFNLSRSASYYESGIGRGMGFTRLQSRPAGRRSHGSRASKRT